MAEGLLRWEETKKTSHPYSYGANTLRRVTNWKYYKYSILTVMGLRGKRGVSVHFAVLEQSTTDWVICKEQKCFLLQLWILWGPVQGPRV